MRARPQLPGRAEALRLVLSQGVSNSCTTLIHIAGMDKPRYQPQVSSQLGGVETFSSGIEKLSPAQRAELPF